MLGIAHAAPGPLGLSLQAWSTRGPCPRRQVVFGSLPRAMFTRQVGYNLIVPEGSWLVSGWLLGIKSGVVISTYLPPRSPSCSFFQSLLTVAVLFFRVKWMEKSDRNWRSRLT